MISKKQAQKFGKQLLERMEGEGWKLQVTSTVETTMKVPSGYFYYVYIPNTISVHPMIISEKPEEYEYYCLLGGSSHGEIIWDDDFVSKDPNETVRHRIDVAESKLPELIDRLQKVLDRAKQAIK